MVCYKFVGKLASRMKPIAFNFTKPSPSSIPRLSRSLRLPVELSCCLETMMPLHSAIASARLKSNLSVEAKCWGLISQGISTPL